tara:strand:+ start:1144 stop:2328 length:1185 start_codon:yes stop_codon:yes gene_type:complete
MLFQTLDDKAECLGVYAQGVIHWDAYPAEISRTWSYSPGLAGHDIDYAQMRCGGLSLNEVCPPELKSDWDSITKRMRAYLTSFGEAKISLEEHCFYSLVPERFLVDLCEIKNKICQHVFENYPKPDNYDFMLKVVEMAGDISTQKLNVNKSSLRPHLGTIKGRSLWKNIDVMGKHVKYNPYGTKTGRLSTVKGSFPILTLNKSFRDVLTPNHDWFVELDFNAAELRTLLALAGEAQPEEDIHAWNIKNVYGNSLSREEAKQRIFAWLYNPAASDRASSDVYKRDKVLGQYWDGGSIRTPFQRTIEADKKHALNYLVQSTSSDIFLDRAVAIHNYLKNKKSQISMLIHDSVVLDVADCDLSDLKEMVEIFSNTPYGKYKVGVSVGKSFGDMRKVR